MQGDLKKEEGKDFTLEFLPDKPTTCDEIGVHHLIAESLKHVLIDGLPKPFVVGLYGTWGSGKSSVVEMLQSFKDRRFKIIIIDAWRKDKENFLRQFIKKLAKELLTENQALEINKKIDFKHSEQIHSWIPGKLAVFGFVIFILVSLCLLFGTVWNYYNVPLFPTKDIVPLEFLILTAIAFQWLLPKYSHQIQVQTEEITIEDPAWFRKVYFDEILHQASGISVCVVIDNLDRVAAEDALAIIKYIKTFIVDSESEKTIPKSAKVSFLFPCDDARLIQRIKNDDQDDETAKEFLRKFINISIRIPPLLDQDNTNYIRGLISKTGIRAKNHILENMAFIISRASNKNPRKPKIILNHFVARFNLAANFPDCWKIIQERPDWFLLFCVTESEVVGFNVTDESDPSKRLADNILFQLQTNAFTSATRPIIEEIPNGTWRIFQYLKQSNIHSLIPGFTEMVDFALTRDSVKFCSKFSELFAEHPYLVADLWNERKDSPSRMAFAEAILSARESSFNFFIPPQVQNEIAGMIQMTVAGWTHLPPIPTYDLILKSRHDCLKSILSSFRSNDAVSSPKALDFLHKTMSLIMRDFSASNELRNEIIAVLELRAKDDGELAQISIGYPQFESRSVVVGSLNSVMSGASRIQAEMIVQYIHEISKRSDRTFLDACLQLVQNEISAAFLPITKKTESQQVALCKLSHLFLSGFARKIFGTGAQINETETRIFGEIQTNYPKFQQAGFNDGIYYVIASGLELTDSSSNPTAKQNASNFCHNAIDHFLKTAPPEFVEKILKKYSLSAPVSGSAALSYALGRSASLVKLGFEGYEQKRSDIVLQMIRTHPEWLAEIAMGFKKEKQLAEQFGLLLINYAKVNPSELFYKTFSRLGNCGEKFKKALENYFNGRISANDSNTINGLESVLQAMDWASYKPTEAQIISLRKIRDQIPLGQLTGALRQLVERFLSAQAKQRGN